MDMFNEAADMPLLSTTSNEEGATGGDLGKYRIII